MNKEEKIKKLKDWAWSELELDHNIEDILLIESNINDAIGYVMLYDDSYKESCFCEQCLSTLMIFKIRHSNEEDYLAAVYSKSYFDKMKDKTNGGTLSVKGSLLV